MNESSKAEWSSASSVEIGKRASLSYVAVDLLREELTPSAFLELLLGRGLYSDAMRFLTYGLPLRRSIWWGCLCVRRAAPALPPDQEAGLKAAAHWAKEPTDARRQAAEQALGEDPFATPAGHLAYAANLMGSRIAYPGTPPIPPDPKLAARMVNGAVQGMAARAKGKPRAQVQREFVSLGIHVLQGRYLWNAVECP
jgi:hypothetical protein